MVHNGKRYTEEFKQQIIDLLLAGKSVAQLADEYGLVEQTNFYSRKIIGWAYGTTMTADLAVKADENACLNVSDSSGIILHSDLGTQYTSDRFEHYLAEKKINRSFSRKGCPYDNS